jgi:photosystem II stability/assembly factor-like uncharacterized protein
LDTRFDKLFLSILKALPTVKLFLFVLLFCFYTACKKEKEAEIEWTNFASGTHLDLKDIAFFPNTDTLFLCAGKREEHGVVLRSVNKGLNWTTSYENNAISMNALYFKTSQVGFALGDYLDIYKTQDGGLTWKHCVFRDTVNFNYRVVLRNMKFTNDSTAFVCGGDDFGNGVVLKSTDNGETWSKVMTDDHEFRDLHFRSDKKGFLCGYGVFYSSNDTGKTWNPSSLSDEFFTSFSFVNESTAYMCGYNGNIYKSTDAGESWNQSRKGNTLFSSKRNQFTAIEFSTTETGIAVGNAGFALLTTDGGKSWKNASEQENAHWNQVKFTSEFTGWALGEKGTLMQFEIK